MLKTVRKAIAGVYASAGTLTAALVAYNVLNGAQAKWVAGVLTAATPLLTFLGVYKAPANQTPFTDGSPNDA